jgi:hypothetical protein
MLLKSIASGLAAAKRGAVEAAAKAFINERIKHFGQVARLELDTQQKRLYVELELKGESSPVWVQVEGYELQEQGGIPGIRLLGARASREWMTLAVEQYVTGRWFRIPPTVRMVL